MRHLKYLEMKGHTPASVYARRRAIARLAAWLDARYAENGHQSAGPPARADRAGREVYRPGPVLLLDATAADLAAWRASLTTGPGATVAYVSHVQCFYDWAVAEGLRPDNPAAGLPVPRLPRRLPRPVSEEDLMAALAHAGERVRPWLVLAGWAGLRAREIAYLRRECILDTHAPPQLLVDARAGKGRAERLVPASAFVLAELRAAGLPASGYVFRRRDGRPGPIAPHLVSHLAGECLREAGTSATLHQLRHRFLTLAYQQTRDLRLVQELAGHATPQTTAGYTAFDRGEAASAVESLPVPGRLRVVGRRESV